MNDRVLSRRGGFSECSRLPLADLVWRATNSELRDPTVQLLAYWTEAGRPPRWPRLYGRLQTQEIQS
eukprot:14059009-Alexandrium_andersonii.AAC.1